MPPKAATVLLLCLAGGDAVFQYSPSDASPTLTLCTCAKCGSTSLFMGFFKALTGRDWSERTVPSNRRQHFFPQNVNAWKDLPECARAPACAEGTFHSGTPEEPKVGDVTVVVTRDPLERYVSAFHSKIACCGSPRAETSRRSCYGDRQNPRERRANDLLSRAGLPPLEAGSETCMYWGEYADALTRIRRLGRQRGMDPHFGPQPSGCNYSTALLADLSGIGALLNGLQGFGPVPQRYPKDLHVHKSAYRSDVRANATALCEVALPEYAALGRDVPAACSLSRAVAS